MDGDPRSCAVVREGVPRGVGAARCGARRAQMKPSVALPRGVRERALYPDHYVWYVIAATLDVLVTYVIIGQLGGREVNRVAGALVERFGHWGLIGLKYASVVLVVLIC